MPAKAGTLEILAQQVGAALQPLETRLAPANVLAFFAELGVAFPPQLLQPAFVSALAAASTASGALTNTLKKFALDVASDNTAGIVADAVTLVQQIRAVISSFPSIGVELGKLSASLPGISPVEVSSFAQTLPANLLSHSLISHLEDVKPSVLGVANLLGVVRYRPDLGDPANPIHPPFIERKLQLSNLSTLLTSPASLLKSLYQWGGPSFNGSLLLPTLDASLNLLGASPEILPPNPLLAIHTGLLNIDPSTTPPGLRWTLLYDLPAGLDITLPLSPLWAMRAQVQGSFKAGLEALVVPPSSFSLKSPGATGTGLLQIDLVARGPDSRHPLILLGEAEGSRLQADSFRIGTGLEVKWGAGGTANAEPVVQMELTGGKAVITTSGADSFIAKILSGLALEADFGFSLLYSVKDGLRFQGSSALDIELASHVSLGPVAINAITLSVGINKDAFPFILTADIQASLGPLVAIVKHFGFGIDLRIAPDNKGNVGPIDIGPPHFEAPTGIGLSVDGGGFRGGGALGFDPAKGEYFGLLELTFSEIVSVRAVAVLSTRLLDGSGGFSLLIIISAEFVPIQLSYGFTLLGVGGLLGLNRNYDQDVIQAGVSDGTLSSILFPTDVVANSSRIISDVKRVFPAQDGTFLMGPMGKLGYGTPTLASVELGLFLRVPIPGFVILGILRVQLPSEDFGTMYIQVNFAGGVDFEKGQLWFDADLVNSRILLDPITGGLVLRIYWGGEPNFLLSAGGFHPSYTPPPMNIGPLERIGFVVVAGIPMVRAEVYLAITSNSVQFGAKVEVIYGVSFFNVFGFVALDVLIQFNPFLFVAEITAMFGVRTGSDVLFGIRVTGTLKGPTPWNVHGEASFLIGFIIKVRLSANFDVTSGESRTTLLPSINVIGEIQKAVDNVSNWRAVLPNGSNQHVSLRELPDAGDALVLHPFGALEISQKIVPLDIAIQRFGSRRPDRGSIFRFASVTINKAKVTTGITTEQFAPAQFFDMSDAEKLSRPSFARYESGLTIGADNAPQTDFRRGRGLQYEVIYLPEPQPVRLFFKLFLTLFNSFARGGAAAQSPLSQERRAPSALAAEHVSLAAETYAVVSTLDMTIHAAPLVFDSATAADQAVVTLIAGKPELTGAIQVVPSAQIRRAV
jgi:hypothetical protein